MFALLEGRNPWLGFPNHVHVFFWLPRHPKTKELGYPTPFPPPQDWTSLCQKLRWHFGKFMCNSCLSKDEGNIGSKTWAFVWYHMNVTSWHGMAWQTWHDKPYGLNQQRLDHGVQGNPAPYRSMSGRLSHMFVKMFRSLSSPSSVRTRWVTSALITFGFSFCRNSWHFESLS